MSQIKFATTFSAEKERKENYYMNTLTSLEMYKALLTAAD